MPCRDGQRERGNMRSSRIRTWRRLSGAPGITVVINLYNQGTWRALYLQRHNFVFQQPKQKKVVPLNLFSADVIESVMLLNLTPDHRVNLQQAWSRLIQDYRDIRDEFPPQQGITRRQQGRFQDLQGGDTDWLAWTTGHASF